LFISSAQFFSDADGFIDGMVSSIIPSRDSTNPDTKVCLDSSKREEFIGLPLSLRSCLCSCSCHSFFFEQRLTAMSLEVNPTHFSTCYVFDNSNSFSPSFFNSRFQVIMPDDNDASFGIDAELPALYWSAPETPPRPRLPQLTL
jgi:hypothetical protein